MKELDSIPNVQRIAPFIHHLVVFASNGEKKLLEEVLFVPVESFYTLKYSDKCLIYQVNKSESVFLISQDLESSEIKGEYSILGAFEYQSGFAVANRESKSYHYIEPNKTASTDLGFYYKKSGNLNEEYLFKRLGDEVTLFSLSNRQEVKSFDIPKDYEIDASLEDEIFTKEKIMYAPLSDGKLLALDVSNGTLLWKQERVGRTALFENMIYCIADYRIKELDANTGEILREESMQDLVETYRFRPTGAHKVYDEYIFVMASGKPGMVAVYDRKTLKFREMLKLDEMIPIGIEHLHWHREKLYILDFTKTLHIYQL